MGLLGELELQTMSARLPGAEGAPLDAGAGPLCRSPARWSHAQPVV